MKAGKGWSRAFAGVVSAACAASLCLAAEAPPLQGRPAIERFVPDLGTYPRQFAVEQGPSGIVHVGGADGLLTFDGTTWHSHDVGSEELVRSLAHDGRSRLYVGGYDTFGYFETPLVGEGRYVELVSRFGIDEPDFADIWQVEIMPEGVFFVGLNDVFRFDPASGRTGHWQHPGKFGALARIGDRLLLQYRGEGLREWHDGDFVPVPGSEGPGRQIFHLVPVGQDTGLAMDRDGGWIEIRPPGHAALEMPSGVPDSSYFASVLALGEGRLALGSVDGWLYFIDLAEGSVRSFRVAHDWISDLAWSPEGGIIAQTDLETLFVRWPSQWAAIGTDEGLNGAVMRVLPWQGRWLAITNGGVFATTPDDAGRFEPLPWTEFEAWDFLPLGDGSGLLADSYAVKHVDLEGVRATSEAITYPRRIVASRFHERRYYVGSEAGLGIFEFRDGELEPLLIPGADGEAIFTLVETAPDELLLGTQGSGVLRARIQADGTALVAERVDSGIDYGDAEYADLVEIDGSVHAVTENGFWRHVDGDFVRTDLDGLDALRVDDHFLEVRQAPDGRLWAFDFNRLFRHDGEAGWQRMDVDALFR
ncbi:MAG: hypothetical protein R3323_07385, partial [Wenzhouxiangellaceae bacterium]|nr:hypothetical protein [Wenzhouxiangellaceae bacterium]